MLLDRRLHQMPELWLPSLPSRVTPDQYQLRPLREHEEIEVFRPLVLQSLQLIYQDRYSAFQFQIDRLSESQMFGQQQHPA